MTRTVAGLRVAVALLMLSAVTRNVVDHLQDGDFVAWDFFGYFTIQSNLIGATALMVSAAYTLRERPAWVEYLRACAAVYLLIVVSVYWPLLSPIDEDIARWTNIVVHGVSCVAVVGDWLLAGPRRPLPLARLWVVMVYPLVWATVTLIRGATDGWVPYPFLDPVNGYAAVAVVIAGIVVAGLAVGAVLFRATRWRVLTPEAAG
ncbi:Pr6Pr family membrane protein [Demequina rhizosphaerae]|uniref:Pr6Pr family membrane protein n=1 Tax=Demequina rhizosphaerae TaxID=1638985 RepID=UPI0007867F67|nr:Pr6Pr family membrane protein [Demequina rhizosphaerae]